MNPSIFILLLISLTFCQDINLKLQYHEHGSVEANSFQYFKLDSIPELGNASTVKLVFVSQPTSGDVELYVSTTKRPTRTEFNWKSTHTGPNSIAVSRYTPGWTRGPYYVGVYGVWKSNYKIISYIDNEGISLDNGEPQVALGKPSNYQYFNYSLTESTTLHIGISSIVSYHYLLIDTVPNPTFSRQKWYSFSSGTEVITIRPEDRNFIVGTYYIAVFSYSTGNLFQVSATKNNTVELLTEGISQPREVYLNQYQYFEYEMSSRNEIWMEVSPRTPGNIPNLCVSTQVKRPRAEDRTCTWNVIGVNAVAQLSILTTDPNFRNSTYYVGVYGFPHQNNNQNRMRFMVTVASRLYSRLLIDGSSLNLVQQDKEYSWYRVYYPFVEDRFIFEAYNYQGSAELYLSDDQTNSHPTRENYNIKFTKFGSISRAIYQYGKVGWLYLGVYANGNSNFTLFAQNSHSPVRVPLGRPYYYYWGLPYGVYKYFLIDLIPGKNQDIIIQVDYIRGDGTLFIGKVGFPTEESNTIWRSPPSSRGIEISKEDLAREGVETLYIGVRNDMTESLLCSILVFYGDTPVEILAGRPTKGSVQYGKYIPYFFRNQKTSRLRITLNTIDVNSDVNLYVDTEPAPTYQRFKWRTFNYSPKYIVIPEAREGVIYYISAYGNQFNISSNYEIRISMDFEILEDGGKPFLDDVNYREYRLYHFWIPPQATRFQISTTLIDGYTELYASPNDTVPTRWNATLGTWDWPGNVILLTNKSRYWKTGTWSVATYGYLNSDYFISAQTELGELTLGLPSTGASTVENIQYYWAGIDLSKNVFISVKVPDQGCVNIYVSQTTDKPRQNNFKWFDKSKPLLGNQVMFSIKKTEYDLFLPWIYIGVQACYDDGFWPHQYEITVAQDDTPMYLSQEYETFFSEDFNGIQRQPWFILNQYKHSKGFQMFMQSCTSAPVGGKVFYTTNETAQFPINWRNAQMSSTTYSPYSEGISVSGTQFAEKKMLVGLGNRQPGRSSLYSIFSSTKSYDPRPKVTRVSKHFLKFENQGGKRQAIFSIDIPMLTGTVDYPVMYELFISKGGRGNFHTPCGIRNNQNAKIVKTWITFSPSSYSVPVPFIDYEEGYYVNVIVTDLFSRSSCQSQPIYLDDYDTTIVVPPPPNNNFYNLSLGGVFLMILSVSIVIYLLIGMILKRVVYKSTGIDLIPNVEFWKEVGSLFKEGVIFAFKCQCRKSDSYANLEDNVIPDSTSNDDSTNPFQENPGEKKEYDQI